LVSKEKGGHLFTRREEFTKEKPKFYHMIYDPIAIYMESYVSDFLKISNCIISPILTSESSFMKELNVQLISCPDPIYEKISPRIGQPTSVLYPPIHFMNVKRQVSNNERREVISDQLSMHDYKFYDPVGLYIEMSFPKANY
jgi:hypothetical protein